MSHDAVRRLAHQGVLPSVWRNGLVYFPRASTEAYAKRVGLIEASDAKVDAIAFGMMRSGATNETIVCELEIPLERVLTLRAARDDASVETETDTTKRELDARQAELSRNLERDRAERRRKLTS